MRQQDMRGQVEDNTIQGEENTKFEKTRQREGGRRQGEGIRRTDNESKEKARKGKAIQGKEK